MAEDASIDKPPLFKMASEVEDSLREIGVRIHPSSRIGQFKRVMFDPDGAPRSDITPESTDFTIALEAIRDVHILHLIIRTFGTKLSDDCFKESLHRLTKDNSLPQDDTDSSGRDAQFELLVAAIAHRARLAPEFGIEPDMTWKHSDQVFGIAVKRVKSEPAIVDRVADAANQIFNSVRPGIVLIDISRALNPPNVPIDLQISDFQFNVAAGKMQREFERRKKSDIISCTRGKWVHGVIVHDFHLRRCQGLGWEFNGYYFAIPCTENTRRAREFKSIFDRYCDGLPNLRSH